MLRTVFRKAISRYISIKSLILYNDRVDRSQCNTMYTPCGSNAFGKLSIKLLLFRVKVNLEVVPASTRNKTIFDILFPVFQYRLRKTRMEKIKALFAYFSRKSFGFYTYREE